MTSEEEILRGMAIELQILEETAETLQSRINLVTAAINDLRVANSTLEGLGVEKENTSLFVPIGGGSYIKARLESSEKVIVGVGAGVVIEKTLEEAEENVGNRLAELEKTRITLQQQLTQVIQQIQDGRSKFQELTAKLTEKERRESVRKTEGRP